MKHLTIYKLEVDKCKLTTIAGLVKLTIRALGLALCQNKLGDCGLCAECLFSGTRNYAIGGSKATGK